MPFNKHLSLAYYFLAAICFIASYLGISAAAGWQATDGFEPMVAGGGAMLWGTAAAFLFIKGHIWSDLKYSGCGFCALMMTIVYVMSIVEGRLWVPLLLNMAPVVFLFAGGWMLILAAIDLWQGKWNNRLGIP